MSDPYLPLYVGDYLKDTGHLSTEQHGAYLMLLMRLWTAGGSLPDDEAKLARLAGLSVKKWRHVWLELKSFFRVSEGVVSHGRIDAELEKAGAIRAKRASAGAKGAAAKSLKNQQPTQANAVAGLKQIRSVREEVKREANASPKKASRLSPDWTLPGDWQTDAIEAGLPMNRIELEAAKLRDWSQSSPKGAKLDWRATWRNWCREAAGRMPQARGSPASSAPTVADVFAFVRKSNEPQIQPPGHGSGARAAIQNLPVLRARN